MSQTTWNPRSDVPGPTSLRRSRSVVAALLLAAAVPLSACGGDPVDPGPAPAPALPTETSEEGGSQSPSADDAVTEDPAATPSDDTLPSDSAQTTDG